MSKEQLIEAYEDAKTKTIRYKVNGVDITSSIEVLKEQFLNQWNKEHKITTELTFYERNKIIDLEAKLAESEKKNFELIAKLNLKEHRPAFCTLADRECEALGEVEELKQQLADKQEEINKLQTFNKSLNSIKEDMCKRLELIRTSSKKDYIRNMEQQLAEKDEEIESLTTDLQEALTIIREGRELVGFNNKALEQSHQEKISFTIEQLKKVKENLLNFPAVTNEDIKILKKKQKEHFDKRLMDFCKHNLNFIDNQIKMLEEGK